MQMMGSDACRTNGGFFIQFKNEMGMIAPRKNSNLNLTPVNN
jgi:hypothetical protein